MSVPLRLIIDSNMPILVEKTIKNQFAKPLAYFESIEEAAGTLKAQGYGIVEIPPSENKGQMSYIIARVNSSNNIIINLITYGYGVPRNTGRPFYLEYSSDWRAGDIIYNTDFVLNKVMGWICIQDGIPGEWKSFGTFNDIVNEDGFVEVTHEVNFPIYYGELPPVGGAKAGKLILYAKDKTSNCIVYYCSPRVNENQEIEYHWLPAGSDEIADYVKHGILKNQNNDWILTRIGEYDISDYSQLREKAGTDSYLVICSIPSNSSDNQKLIIAEREFILKFDDSSPVLANDLQQSVNVLAFQFDPAVDNKDSICIQNVPIAYINRRLSEITSQLTNSINALEDLTNLKFQETNTTFNTRIEALITDLNAKSQNLMNSINSLDNSVDSKIGLVNSQISQISSDLTTAQSTLNTRIDTVDSSLRSSLSDNVTFVLSEINQVNTSLLQQISEVSDNLKKLINNQTVLNGATVNDTLRVTGVLNADEFILPVEEGTQAGATWFAEY